MMDNEDRQRACKTVPDPTASDPNAQAISGINSAAYPGQFAAIEALPQTQRGPAVEQFYRMTFWNKWFDQLTSDDIAKRVLDAAVNMGPVTAVKILQQAVGSVIDGTWGPNTVAAVNADDNAVPEFQIARLAHYQQIVQNNPAEAHFLGDADNPGPWWMRAVA
jgi:lysozyme family protein